MTQREKELFIANNLQNLPKLTNGHYNARWVIVFNGNGTKYLYEDTEYTTNPSFISSDTNWVITNNATFDNGNIPRRFVFDVTFLFEDNFVSSFGCILGTPPPLTHSLSFIHHYDADSELDTWNIADNGFENSDYQVWHSPWFYNYYYVEVPHPDLFNESYTSLSVAQNAVKNYFIRDGYPGVSGDTIYAKYNHPLKDYIDCLKTKVNQCCLKQCFN